MCDTRSDARKPGSDQSQICHDQLFRERDLGAENLGTLEAVFICLLG